MLKDIAPNNDWTYHSVKLLFSNRNRKCTLEAHTKLAFNRIFSPTAAAQTMTISQSKPIYHFLLCSKGSKITFGVPAQWESPLIRNWQTLCSKNVWWEGQGKGSFVICQKNIYISLEHLQYKLIGVIAYQFK